jgi:heme/copper-type cytochrome/quinol oxidase subunit 2
MWEQWDIGLKGLAVLAAYSLAFGILAQVVMWRSVTHWLWLIAAATFFVAGLLISEVWFGSATEADLQPNIDGLSRDEALLAVVPAVIAVYITWAFGRRHHARNRPIHA